MFLENKYRRWYTNLMDRALARKLEGPVEWHHVIPKCLGGTYMGIVALTFREHFLAHWLLIKFTVGEDQRKMRYALVRCMDASKQHGTSRAGKSWQYDLARRARIDALTGRKRPPFSEETCGKMSESAKKRATSESMSKVASALRGYKRSEEFKAKVSRAKLGDKNPMSRASKLARQDMSHQLLLWTAP